MRMHLSNICILQKKIPIYQNTINAVLNALTSYISDLFIYIHLLAWCVLLNHLTTTQVYL